MGDIQELPLGLGVMLLTTLEESQAPAVARYSLNRTHEEIVTPSSQAMMESWGERKDKGKPAGVREKTRAHLLG